MLNKRARHNVCFGVAGQTADFENKKGTIIAYREVPFLSAWKNEMESLIGESSPLQTEGNKYYDCGKCGIGFHGDSERKKVVAASFGETREIHWQWYHWSRRIGRRVKVTLNNGDMYIMSEKATGYDWKKRKIKTIRHAAGAEKYLK